MSDPLDPLLRLQERVAEVLARHGLVIERLSVSPSTDGAHEVQLQASLPGGWDRTETDEQFDEVLASAEKAEAERAAEQAQAALEERLRRHLDDGDGIL